MYDPTIHAKTLARQVRKADFAADSSLTTGSHLNAAIERAVTIGLSGFNSILLRTNILRGKTVYQLGDLSESLVVRHITSNIRRITGVKQDDRQFIVSCMQKMLSEGTAFRVYKFDIASFYESVSSRLILKQLEADAAFSGQSIRALRSLFIQLDAVGVVGLPRGMSLSATLAEYLLRRFDSLMAGASGVWFYARFVDDVVIITDGREDNVEFTKLAGDRLPSGLQFNQKSTSLDFAPFDRANGATEESCFDFLGYHFSVSFAHRNKTINNRVWRDAWLDIAPSKVRKIKTRIARSLLSYRKDGDFALLLARFQLLTSNFNFVDLKTGIRRTSGIYYNYPLIDGDRSLALRELDQNLVSSVASPHPRNRLRPAVTRTQRQQLLNLRFQGGFRNRRFFSFSADRLSDLTACWAYA